jgi:hypothetical protein
MSGGEMKNDMPVGRKALWRVGFSDFAGGNDVFYEDAYCPQEAINKAEKRWSIRHDCENTAYRLDDIACIHKYNAGEPSSANNSSAP